MPSDTYCPTCGSPNREWRGDLPHFDEEGNVTEYEDCSAAWHLEAAATPPTSDAVRAALADDGGIGYHVQSIREHIQFGDACDVLYELDEIDRLTAALADRADSATVARLEAEVAAESREVLAYMGKMVRIAIALFGDHNNVSDDECIERIEVLPALLTAAHERADNNWNHRWKLEQMLMSWRESENEPDDELCRAHDAYLAALAPQPTTEEADAL